MDWKVAGAFGFGALIGWYVYYINRYRKGEVQMTDLATLIGAIGGAAVLALFDKSSDLFGAYGVGLAVGFFGYFIVLLLLVWSSKNFDSDWFLDGRRKHPSEDVGYGQEVKATTAPMTVAPSGTAFFGTNPGAPQTFYIGTAGAPHPTSALQQQFVKESGDAIIRHCKDVWPSKKDACNFFVIEVADRVGVSLTGRADAIVDQIRGSGWTKLSDGKAARAAAIDGKLVVAGMKSTEFTNPSAEGHVCVVVAGAMNGGGWAPAGFWGSTDSAIAEKGGGGNPISLCFRANDSPKITYAIANG